MATARTAVPKAMREQVLREYNHLCAICGAPNPQLHHIDGDHSRHESDNLLPLCPNHHLSDQHNPTRKIDSRRVLLFRRFKDPAILSAQFEPLFNRLLFLDNIEGAGVDLASLEAAAKELTAFVEALGMGTFYASRLYTLTAAANNPRAWGFDTPTAEFERWGREDLAEYVAKLLSNRDEIRLLCIELLRYQDWAPAAGI